MVRLAACLTLLFSLALLGPDATHAQDRSIAVVYDDSGSMEDGGRWWYANYAFQTLVGLLDESDTLRFVTMSQPDEIRDMDLGNRGGIMRNMQEQSTPGASTPYVAVTTAVDALRETTAEHKWLVVISDGNFEIPSSRSLKNQINDFRETVGGQVIFLVLGSSEAEVKKLSKQPAVQAWQSRAQATVYTAVGASDITQQLQQIAADVTSRTLGIIPNASRQGATIRLRSEFPLRRLTLLEQKPSGREDLHTVQSAEIDGTSLSQLTQLDAEMPELSKRTLFGRITHIKRQGNQVISPGFVTVSLDRPVSADEFKILPEVAARLTTSLDAVGAGTLQRDGDVYTACLDDTLSLQATLITPSGDTLLQRVQDPTSIDVSATKGQQDTPLTLSSSGRTFTHTFTAPKDTTTISVTAQYPGYFNFKSKLYTLRGTECQPARSLSFGSPVEPWTADVTDVPETPPLRIEPLADGKPIPPEEFEEWSIQVVKQPSDLNLALGRDSATSTWTMRPTLRWGLPQLTPTGSFPVTIRVSSPRTNEDPIQKKVHFSVREVPFWALWGSLLLALLGLLLLLIYLYGILTKPRFPRGSKIVYEQGDHKTHFPLPRGTLQRWLVPFTPEENEVGSISKLRFRATDSPAIVLPKGQQSESMKVGPHRLTDPLHDKFVDPGTTVIYPADDGLEHKFKYRS